MLLRTLESSLLGNLLTSKRSQIPGREVVCTGESTTRGDEGKVKPDQVFLMQPHLLTNVETQNYYQNKSNFNGVYSRNNLPTTKDGAYLINLDDYRSIGTHWIVLHMNSGNVTNFDSFAVEHIPK